MKTSTTTETPPPARPTAEIALSVRNLSTTFRTDNGLATAVSNVSFDLFKGEALGIVGESGCGKSVTAKSIMRLLPEHITSYGENSEVMLGSENLLKYSRSDMHDVRGDRIGMIFQEPMTALNPVFTIGWQIDEALKLHTKLDRRQRRVRGIEMLKMVDMPNAERRYDEYPHQLSGGMRQRVLIAIALACEPEVLIADEPTTALDVTIQAQILKLMSDLRERTGTAILLITHDLGVVAQTCDRVVVMYAGQVVETAPVHDLFHDPAHPYTKALLESIPRSGSKQKGKRLPTISGLVPGLFEMPEACRFAERCAGRQDKCVQIMPEVDWFTKDRCVRCHFPVNEGA
ncbi:ABC transporter ATP-binding protein [Fuerstiella marisgermanici]|uniref:Stage 0 sporulation protein KD n=1 Tax=Fuerstiella marisgermanici TaxID=1891926 RepID=A0A1P8WF27_9PLAN|nr:ABC transporter ATP-binding protein [Fuerstiella marisgermanici]APZ92674.1 Stage 0 sporulation protein KD [Fuerstiella marisgermanici]